jgi:protein TonB
MPTPGTPVPVASYPLQLAVELPHAGLLSIRWNPEIATQARQGRLIITGRDKQNQTTVMLTPQFLKTGHLDYPFPAEQLGEIQLEIDGPSGVTAKESIGASSLGVLVSPAQGIALPSGRGNRPAAVPRVETKTIAQPAAIKGETPPSSRSTLRQFVPTVPSQRGKEEVLLEPPPVVNSPAVLVGTNLPTVVSLPAPAAKEIPVNRQTTVGGSSQAASLIKKVPPTYPPLAKVQHIQGTVRFAATIEKDGTIDRLRVLSGPALLVPSAMVAVRQWLYRPAMANGNPIEATTQVEVTFTLNQ